MLETIWAVFSIVIIDLALSGDNAAVIGMAIKDLPTEQRKQAAFIGAGGAIVLRIIFTAIATVLLTIPYLRAFGGLILVWITWKLLNHKNEEENIKVGSKFWSAVGTIIIADLSMAFDNVMGVAGAAQGHIGLLVFGLALSIPILIIGASWLANLMNRYPIIIYIGGAVLIHTALAMIFKDHGLGLTFYVGRLAAEIIPWAMALAVLFGGWLKIRQSSSPAPDPENIINIAEVAVKKVAVTQKKS